eukprot:9268123-Pyramimonas_sp.AAC.1
MTTHGHRASDMRATTLWAVAIGARSVAPPAPSAPVPVAVLLQPACAAEQALRQSFQTQPLGQSTLT